MRTIETNVFEFNELSDSAKETAIQWYRSCIESSDYAETVIYDAKEIGALFGLDIDEVYYSGFSSQGDGACFVGKYSYKKGSLKAIKAYTPKYTELHDIVARLQHIQRQSFYKLSARCTHSGHYYHSGCMSIDVDHDEGSYRVNNLIEQDIIDLLRQFADWIYRQLEKEYDYINFNENIIENIICNEYEFDTNGNRA